MLKSNFLYFINHLTNLLPPTKFYSLKSNLYKFAGVKIGKNVRLISSVSIWGNGELVIDDNTFIGHETTILSGGAVIHIGKNVDISSRVLIVNGTHNKFDEPHKAAGNGYATNISIGDGSWVAASVSIIEGGMIGNCCIIGAGALVRNNIPNGSTATGIPAKVIYKESDRDLLNVVSE